MFTFEVFRFADNSGMGNKTVSLTTLKGEKKMFTTQLYTLKRCSVCGCTVEIPGDYKKCSCGWLVVADFPLPFPPSVEYLEG